MDSLADELFPCTALALNENSGVGLRDESDHAAHIADVPTLPMILGNVNVVSIASSGTAVCSSPSECMADPWLLGANADVGTASRAITSTAACPRSVTVLSGQNGPKTATVLGDEPYFGV